MAPILGLDDVAGIRKDQRVTCQHCSRHLGQETIASAVEAIEFLVLLDIENSAASVYFKRLALRLLCYQHVKDVSEADKIVALWTKQVQDGSCQVWLSRQLESRVLLALHTAAGSRAVESIDQGRIPRDECCDDQKSILTSDILPKPEEEESKKFLNQTVKDLEDNASCSSDFDSCLSESDDDEEEEGKETEGQKQKESRGGKGTTGCTTEALVRLQDLDPTVDKICLARAKAKGKRCGSTINKNRLQEAVQHISSIRSKDAFSTIDLEELIDLAKKFLCTRVKSDLYGKGSNHQSQAENIARAWLEEISGHSKPEDLTPAESKEHRAIEASDYFLSTPIKADEDDLIETPLTAYSPIWSDDGRSEASTPLSSPQPPRSGKAPEQVISPTVHRRTAHDYPPKTNILESSVEDDIENVETKPTEEKVNRKLDFGLSKTPAPTAVTRLSVISTASGQKAGQLPAPAVGILPSINTPEFYDFIGHTPEDICHKLIKLLKTKLPANEREGYVYVFKRASSPGYVKIGRTIKEDVQKGRLAGWNGKCKYTPVLVSARDPKQKVAYHKRLEKLIHAELAYYRRKELVCNRGQGCSVKHHGEWFEVKPDVALACSERWQKWLELDPYMTNPGSTDRVLRQEWRDYADNFDYTTFGNDYDQSLHWQQWIDDFSHVTITSNKLADAPPVEETFDLPKMPGAW